MKQTTLVSPAAGRWVALDILRGLSVIGMLLVVNPGAWDLRYSWLSHIDWQGLGAADMVFPGFLFCVGMALPISLARRLVSGDSAVRIGAHILWRSAALVLLGVLLNAFPGFDFSQVRLPGILQRIGLCYGLVASLLLLVAQPGPAGILRLNTRILVAVVAGLVLGYWLLLSLVAAPGAQAPAFDSVNSLPAWLDRSVFTVAHLWPWGLTDGKVTYDPEGLLATLPACVNVLAGALACHFYLSANTHYKNLMFTVAGVVLMLLALALDPVYPIIKKIWTGSFALFSVGVSLVLLAAIDAVIRKIKTTALLYPIHVFGANALLAFSVSTLIGPLMDIPLETNNAASSLRNSGFAFFKQLLGNPPLASFCYSLVVTGLIFLLMSWCYQRRWFLRL